MPFFRDRNGLIGHISIGDDPFVIDVAGKRHYFVTPPCQGLFWVKKNGDERKGEPPKEFWDAVERWEAFGRQLDGMRCIAPPWCRTCSGYGSVEDPNEAEYNAAHKRSKIVITCPTCEGKNMRRIHG